jgi:4-amino-4-deoxy-L-arabinose transferase-like glycosyltransferase
MLRTRVEAHLIALGVSLLTAWLMLSTEPRMAIQWDEGYTLGREEALRDWFRALADPPRFAAGWHRPPLEDELVQRPLRSAPPRREQLDSRSKLLFDRDVLAWFWPFAREEPHGHPPFYALIGLAGDVLAPSWPELSRARLGPILLFSLTAGAIFAFLATRWGYWAASLAAGSWVLQPNLFAHGHYASYDGVLTSLWALSIIAFASAIEEGAGLAPRTRRFTFTVSFGLVLGCAAATKFTGWFLPLPFLAWSVLYRSRRGFITLAAGLVICGFMVFALQPSWWSEPVVALMRFVDSNLNRGRTIPIKVQFLGTIYDSPNESLPWYNTLVWTIMVTPVGFLVIAGMGIAVASRNWRKESLGVLLTGHWLFLIILRALPHTPGHDGVRLFLPAFGVVALLGGLGARWLANYSGRWSKVAIGAALTEGVVSIAMMMPVPLSYFSPIVGGLPGATKLGMEPTYYWDALSPEARRWLADHTLPGRTFSFRGWATSWLYLRRTGDLPRQLAPIDAGSVQWVVIQNRPGAFSDEDRRLVANGRPAFTVKKLGVDLIWIFPYSEVERLLARHARGFMEHPERAKQQFAWHPQGAFHHEQR